MIRNIAIIVFCILSLTGVQLTLIESSYAGQCDETVDIRCFLKKFDRIVEDYDSFDTIFKGYTKSATNCSSVTFLSDYFKISTVVTSKLDMYHLEAYMVFREALENLLLSKTKCFMDALEKSPPEVQGKIVGYIMNPIFVERIQTEKVLDRKDIHKKYGHLYENR